LWVIFALLDPDPDSGSGSTDLIESGSNPDPQPCFLQYTIRDAMRVEEEKRRLKGRVIASTRHNRFGGTFVLKNIQVTHTYHSFSILLRLLYLFVFFGIMPLLCTVESSVGDPDPQDPHVFGPPGSGYISHTYGSRSGSFPFLIKVLRRLK
jgi:hypothetical protein